MAQDQTATGLISPKYVALVALRRIVPRRSKAWFPSATDTTNIFAKTESPPTQLSPPADKGEESTYEGTKNELEEAIEGSNDVLVEGSTTLTLLQDKIVLDRAKLTVIRRNFIGSAEIMSIPIEDVLSITASVGPFFGNIKIMSKILNSTPYEVGKFRRSDALRLKRIAQGYIIALQREIDCNTIPNKELIRMLDQLGEDDHH